MNYSNTGDVVLRNVLIDNNTGGNCGGSYQLPLNADSSNISDDGTCGSATVKTLGEIGPGYPADNGGPTKTIALNPGSAAIDAGNDIIGQAAVGAPAYGAGGMDQRGVVRPQGSHCDVGAFEIAQAVIPIVAPLGGTCENSVQVSITNTSPGTSVRYTLDNSTPSDINGIAYSGPFVLTQTATVKAVAYGPGWLPSPVASVVYSVLTPLPYWRNLQGLPAEGSQDLATPAGDGVANLLKFAFNIAPNAGDLYKPNVALLQVTGTAGLPYFQVDAQGRLVIGFVRRKATTNPGIAYIVETGSDLNNLTTLSLSGAAVVSINSTWERVTVVDATVSTKRFGRVRIQSLGTYFNDFNANLGAATVRGSAIYTNNAIQLTDTVGGQVGAVTFDGINLEPEVTGFTAKFNLQLGPTTSGLPADGASFAVGNLGSGAWGEGGPGTTHHIAVGFDTYTENSGTGTIGIHLWVNGAHVAVNAANPYTNGQFVPVEITYDAASGLTLKCNGVVIFNNTAVTGFTFQATDKFGIGARTGGANERCLVDDVQIAPR